MRRRWTSSRPAAIGVSMTTRHERSALGFSICASDRSSLTTFMRGWRQILRRGDYDAVHDHQEYISGWHFLAASGVLPRVRVTHVHNPILGSESYYGVSVARRLTAKIGWRLVDKFATHVCGTSGEILRRHNYEPGRTRHALVSVVHCGFDAGKFNAVRKPDRKSVLHEFGWSPESKIILFVGRLDPVLEYHHRQNHKNSWFALNVARVAARRDNSVRYLLAGAGDAPRAAMERHIHQWGLRGRLRLIGVRNDVPRLMRAADILLFPSVEEGLGMVAVEAQAAGLPVLASTAVPRESIVVPELYNTMSLQQPIELWATTLLQAMAKQRPSLELSRRAFENSEFSIVNSAHRLMEIYASATP